MKKSIVGIGSALVDILTRIDNDSILEELNIPKGSMQLVDEKSSAVIESKLSAYESSMAPGGSAANTIHGLATLGIESGFISYLGKDEIGKFFEESMTSAGVKPLVFHTKTASGTARTIISADEGVMKPGAEYYLRALRKFSLKADECFFVDDVPANIEGAQFCGIHGAVFYNDVEHLRKNLRDAGVDVAEK